MANELELSADTELPGPGRGGSGEPYFAGARALPRFLASDRRGEVQGEWRSVG